MDEHIKALIDGEPVVLWKLSIDMDHQYEEYYAADEYEMEFWPDKYGGVIMPVPLGREKLRRYHTGVNYSGRMVVGNYTPDTHERITDSIDPDNSFDLEIVGGAEHTGTLYGVNVTEIEMVPGEDAREFSLHIEDVEYGTTGRKRANE